MDKKPAYFSNDLFLLDNTGKIVAVKCDEQKFTLGDRVRIKSDTHGYIQPGITKEGYGIIVDFADDYSDHYFGVKMDNGEYAHVKRARIAEVFPKANA